MGLPEPGEERRWWVRRIGLCLLLGFLTNFVIVLVLAAVAPVLPRERTVAQYRGPWSEGSGVAVHLWHGWGVEDRTLCRLSPPRTADLVARWTAPHGTASRWATPLRGIGRDLAKAPAGTFDWWRGWGLLADVASSDPSVLDTTRLDRAYGWPVLASWCELTIADSVSMRVDGIRGGVALSKADGSASFGLFQGVPLRPIWRGMAINALFYMGVWMSPLILQMSRRTRRIRKGRCGRCGYDLLGELEAGCPECGWGRDGRA